MAKRSCHENRLVCFHAFFQYRVNQIIEEAGIAKSTLYQLFRSKEDLLIVYLEETGERTIEALRGAAAGRVTPREKVLAIFDHLEALVMQPEFYGCQHLANEIYTLFEGALIGPCRFVLRFRRH